MTLPPLLPRLAPLALALASAPLAAQEFVPSTDTSPAACAAIP
ncbi:MAG TPA: phospholipase, partial [Pseudomonas sp.]|nr:phospholipase [Pseudomonas sp.]